MGKEIFSKGGKGAIPGKRSAQTLAEEGDTLKGLCHEGSASRKREAIGGKKVAPRIVLVVGKKMALPGPFQIKNRAWRSRRVKPCRKVDRQDLENMPRVCD